MIFNIILLFNILNLILVSSSYSSNWRGRHRIRNITLKFIIFKKKSVPKLLNYFNRHYEKSYNKLFISVADGIIKYENLSDEDKYIIDFILSTLIS